MRLKYDERLSARLRKGNGRSRRLSWGVVSETTVVGDTQARVTGASRLTETGAKVTVGMGLRMGGGAGSGSTVGCRCPRCDYDDVEAMEREEDSDDGGSAATGFSLTASDTPVTLPDAPVTSPDDGF